MFEFKDGFRTLLDGSLINEMLKTIPEVILKKPDVN